MIILLWMGAIQGVQPTLEEQGYLLENMATQQIYTGCFTWGGTRHFVNNSDTSKDTATKFYFNSTVQ
jgi:hypothetical protein